MRPSISAGEFWVVSFNRGTTRTIVKVCSGRRMPNTTSRMHLLELGKSARTRTECVTNWYEPVHLNSLRSSVFSMFTTGLHTRNVETIGCFEKGNNEPVGKTLTIDRVTRKGGGEELGFLISAATTSTDPLPHHLIAQGHHAPYTKINEAYLSPESMDKILQMYGQWKMTGQRVVLKGDSG